MPAPKSIRHADRSGCSGRVPTSDRRIGTVSEAEVCGCPNSVILPVRSHPAARRRIPPRPVVRRYICQSKELITVNLLALLSQCVAGFLALLPRGRDVVSGFAFGVGGDVRSPTTESCTHDVVFLEKMTSWGDGWCQACNCQGPAPIGVAARDSHACA